MTDTKAPTRGYADQFHRLRAGEDDARPQMSSKGSYSERYRSIHADSGNSKGLAPGFRSYAEQAAAGRARRVPEPAATAVESVAAAPDTAKPSPQPTVKPEAVQQKAADSGSEADSEAVTAKTTDSVKKAPLKQLVARGQPVAFSNKVKRQLARSERELGMVEGNLSSAGKELKTLYFTSCFDGDGKTISAMYAAYGLASHGERVLLIDSNVGKPAMQRYFQTHGPGLAEIIAGAVPVELALHATQQKGLDYIPAGNLPAGAHISNRAMKELLELLKDYYRYIIVDGSSVFSSSEATRMASAVDGLVLVVACEQTRWEVAQSAEEKITSAGGKVIGISMNRRRFYLPRRIYDWLSG